MAHSRPHPYMSRAFPYMSQVFGVVILTTNGGLSESYSMPLSYMQSMLNDCSAAFRLSIDLPQITSPLLKIEFQMSSFSTTRMVSKNTFCRIYEQCQHYWGAELGLESQPVHIAEPSYAYPNFTPNVSVNAYQSSSTYTMQHVHYSGAAGTQYTTSLGDSDEAVQLLGAMGGGFNTVLDEAEQLSNESNSHDMSGVYPADEMAETAQSPMFEGSLIDEEEDNYNYEVESGYEEQSPCNVSVSQVGMFSPSSHDVRSSEAELLEEYMSQPESPLRGLE